MSEKTLVQRGVVEREKGYLYFIDGKGDLYKSKLQTGRKAKTKEEKEEMEF